jgi:hypothetical protein
MTISFKSYAAHRLERHPATFLESPVGTQMNEPVPLLINMTRNVLNSVRGTSDTQSKVLRWIWGEGLHQALVGRKIAAEQASEQLTKAMGKPIVIRQEQLFHQNIYPHIAKRFGIPLETLQQVMAQAVQTYKTKYEPDEIPIGKRQVIKISDLNKHLAQNGLEPFTFDGFAEKYENDEEGKWAPKLAHRNPYGEDDPVRHGLDLTNPSYGEEPGTGNAIYKYNSWAPPVEQGRNYNDAIRDALTVAHGHKDKSTDDPDLDKWYALHKHRPIAAKTISQSLGFRNSTRTPVAVDPQAYPTIKKWFEDGVKSRYPYTEEEHAKIIAQVCDDANHTLRGSFKIHGDKYMPIVAALDAGAALNGYPKNTGVQKAAEEGLIPKSVGYTHDFDDSSYAYSLGDDAYEKVPVDLAKLQEDGWKTVPVRKEVPGTMELKKGNERISLTQSEDGEWHAERRKRGAGTYKKLSGMGNGQLLGLSQIDRNDDGDVTNKLATANPHAHTRERFRLPDQKVTGEIFKNMFSNQAAYGESPLTATELQRLPPLVRQYPPSIVRGAEGSIRKAASRLGHKIDDSTIKNMFSDDLINDLTVRMYDHANDRRFKYGDLKAYRPQVIAPVMDDAGNVIEPGREEPSKYDIYAELRRVGVTDPEQAKQYIQKLKSILDTGREPTADELPQPVIAAFLRNGANWRKRRGADAMSGTIIKHFKDNPGQNKQYKTKEGDAEEVDIEDTGDNKIADMIGRMKGKHVNQARAEDGALVANDMGYRKDAALQKFAKGPAQSNPVVNPPAVAAQQPTMPATRVRNTDTSQGMSKPGIPVVNQPVSTPPMADTKPAVPTKVQPPAPQAAPVTAAASQTAVNSPVSAPTRPPVVGSTGLGNRVSARGKPTAQAAPAAQTYPTIFRGIIHDLQSLQETIDFLLTKPINPQWHQYINKLEAEVLGSGSPAYGKLWRANQTAIMNKVFGKSEHSLDSFHAWKNEKLLESMMERN